jgi:glutamine amidotransferase
VKVALVDYGAGNLRSLRAALERVGGEVTVSDDPEVVAASPLVVVPGVGAAPHAMASLAARGLDGAIRSALDAGGRVFGVCVGLQVLFERSAEGDVPCLGLLPGTVTRLEGARRLPHMGWNDVVPTRPHVLTGALPATCYFAHSFAVQDAPDSVVLARTAAGSASFASVVAGDRVAGVQFHPERSAAAGRALCEALLRWETAEAADAA